MIKTVAFAPPRPRKKPSSASRASGSLVPASGSISENLSSNGISRSTRKTLRADVSPTSIDSLTIPVPAKSTKSKSAKIEANGGLTLAFDFEAPAPVATPTETVATPVVATPKSAPKLPKPKPLATPKVSTKIAESKATDEKVAPPAFKAEESKVVEEVIVPKIKKPSTPKNKRVKVPENLAEQYGAKLSKRVESGVADVPAEEAPKKRLTKVEREARKQLLRPDEGLLQRLHRAANIVPTKQPPRQRGWKFECGRCGRTSYFQTVNAGICECGAIAVKE